MRSTFVRYLIIGQICFYLGLLLCILIRPEGLAANDGISYYGIYRSTILPFIIALLGSSVFCIRAGLELSKDSFKFLRYGLIIIGVLTLGVLLTPYTLSIFISDLHQDFGAMLFVCQLIISGWVAQKLNYDLRALGLVLIEFLGGLLAYYYLKPANGFLLQSQVLFQIGFSLLAVYSLPKLLIETTV